MFWSQPKPCAKSIGCVPRPETFTWLRWRTDMRGPKIVTPPSGEPEGPAAVSANSIGVRPRFALRLAVVQTQTRQRKHPARRLSAPLDGGQPSVFARVEDRTTQEITTYPKSEIMP